MPENPTPMTVEQAAELVFSIAHEKDDPYLQSASSDGGKLNRIIALLRRLPTPCARCGQGEITDGLIREARFWVQRSPAFGAELRKQQDDYLARIDLHLTGAPTR